MKYKTTITKIINETYDTKTFMIKKPANFKYEPGHFCMIRTGEQEIAKPFSLSSSPHEKTLDFTIKKVGEMTTKMFELKKGSEIIIEGPFGEPFKKENCNKYAFIAGGTGIDPIYGFAKNMEHENKNVQITIFYSSKTLDDVLFKKNFDLMKKVKVIYFLTNENKKINGMINSRINAEKILENIEKPKDWKWKAIGPSNMVVDMNKIISKIT